MSISDMQGSDIQPLRKGHPNSKRTVTHRLITIAIEEALVTRITFHATYSENHVGLAVWYTVTVPSKLCLP